MIKKGKVAAIKDSQVKVVYEDINLMTPYIDVAAHVNMTELSINDQVIVAVYDDNLRTGAVIGVIR